MGNQPPARKELNGVMRREWFGARLQAPQRHRGLDTFAGIIAAAALVATVGTAAAAQTAPDTTTGSVSVSGPSVLTAATAFAVTAAASSTKVCRVQETTTGTADFTAPYAISIGLADLKPGTHQLTFVSVDCQGYQIASATKTVTVPVQVKKITPFWVAPSSTQAADHQLTLSVAAQAQPVSATIMKGSTVIATLPTRTTTAASWTWKPGSAAAGTYTVAVKSGTSTVAIPFGVARGWGQMAPAFPRCTTLTWSYSAAGQPARAAGMEADVQSAFARISKATGISFKQVGSKGTIGLSWKKLSGGADGEGGPTSQGNVAIKASVWFSTDSEWVGRKGFGHDRFGNPGRGGLITHEVGHALGLQHVTDPAQIMYPVATAGSPTELAKGDRAGLNALYRARSC